MKHTIKEINAAREIQRNLFQIQETGKAKINLTQYKNFGLVKIIHKNIILSSGQIESVFDKLILTEKGKQYLKVIL